MGWWQDRVMYSLFPLSFADSDGDGYGDLEGARAKLDYLQWLGIGGIWLGPIYRTPLLDVGYDISDFCDVDPVFGSLDGFDAFLADCHRRDIRVVLDFVPNHTSDQHPWFLESRASRDNPKRDWFIWRDAAPDGGVPNNWLDNVERPAWAWDEATGQYYYHRFLVEQPDLNLRNPEVIAALGAAMRFWLDRGVDGFRIDAAMHLVEDELLRDEPEGDIANGPPGWMARVYSTDRAESHDVLRALRQVIDAYDDRLLLGEAILPVTRLMSYYGTPAAPELHFPLNGQLMNTKPWDARRLEAAVDQYFRLLPDGAWPSWSLGSHDVSRIATKIGAAQARIAAMLQLTLPGTPFIYYGDELGQVDVDVPLSQLTDQYAPYGQGRDSYRAPMPWTGEEGGGFTSGMPWLPLLDDYETRNVATLMADEHSILTLYRRLIALRRDAAGLWDGEVVPLRSQGSVLAYRRPGLLVVLNAGSAPAAFAWDGRGAVVLSTHLDREGEVSGTIELRAAEGVVVRVR